MNPLSQTRSTRQLTHLLQTPDTFVRTPMPGLTGGLAVVHANADLGAKFLMFTAELEPGGVLLPSMHSRFFYMLSGQATLAAPGLQQPVAEGHYAYSPGIAPMTLTAVSAARCLILDKPYEPLPGAPLPEPFIRREQDLVPTPLNGDPALLVRAMMPPDAAFDFALNTMEYAPGAALSQVEVHYMEHGLLMLAGEGPYRLGDTFYDTRAGDFIWMAPYCPQWFQASQAGPAKYLIYKNFNRVPAL